ncbi:hypothetical protein [Euhalothece natronophila]|nr:hypothetical protein [Euhalothece natronophila]
MAFLKRLHTNNGISLEQVPMLSVLLAAGCLTSITESTIALFLLSIISTS